MDAAKQVASKGKDVAEKGKDAVAEGASSSGKAVSSVAGKAKWPAVAGGAALAGLAGGVALAGKRNGGTKLLGHPVGGGKATKQLADAGKGMGKFSENLGQLAAEMRQTREAIDQGSKHASPIEVVLRALTARR